MCVCVYLHMTVYTYCVFLEIFKVSNVVTHTLFTYIYLRNALCLRPENIVFFFSLAKYAGQWNRNSITNSNQKNKSLLLRL